MRVSYAHAGELQSKVNEFIDTQITWPTCKYNWKILMYQQTIQNSITLTEYLLQAELAHFVHTRQQAMQHMMRPRTQTDHKQSRNNNLQIKLTNVQLKWIQAF